MSAVTERATRRELRRAMGESAIGVLNSHADTLADVMHGLELFSARLSACEGHLESLRRISESEIEQRRAFFACSFLGRLRWLLTGR